ncbi:MAG TPA: TetR/AcrR family transcriptional regulator [Polyangiaceae bacterium]|nr:TetR/AcrR family transcriptional regulator [Polyangiaceae bacterium]
MVQVRKPEMREAFVAAAGHAFAELGYQATTMADVAKRAGSSIGNLYKYFAGKKELLDAVVPAEFVGKLERLTRARMRAMGQVRDVAELGPDARYHALAGELLDYCLLHRAAVVIALTRAEGTPFPGFAQRFVEHLVRWALDYARGAYPSLRATPELRFVLEHAYRSFVSATAAALLAFPDEARARAVIASLTSQHQGGLKRLFEVEAQLPGGSHAESRHPERPSVVEPAHEPRARGAEPARAGTSANRSGAGQADRPGRAGRRGRARGPCQH